MIYQSRSLNQLRALVRRMAREEQHVAWLDSPCEAHEECRVDAQSYVTRPIHPRAIVRHSTHKQATTRDVG